MLLHQPLNDAGREQQGIDIIVQRRTVMAMAVEAVDGIVDMKSVKRHGITMPTLPRSRFDIDQITGLTPMEHWPGPVIRSCRFRAASLQSAIVTSLQGWSSCGILRIPSGAAAQFYELPVRTFLPSA